MHYNQLAGDSIELRVMQGVYCNQMEERDFIHYTAGEGNLLSVL